MITNMNYLKTALDALESGIDAQTQIKILDTVKFICEQNIERIKTNLVDNMGERVYTNNTERAEGASDDSRKPH